MLKIDIFTEEKKKNDVIKVEVVGKTFEVGVVEYEDEPWFPFKFDNDEQTYESNFDNKSDYSTTVAEGDDDGISSEEEERISDTSMDGVEEGKIVGDGNNQNDNPINPYQASPIILESQKAPPPTGVGEAEPSHAETEVINVNETCDGKLIESGRVIGNQSKTTEIGTYSSLMGSPRPIPFPSNFAQSRCFGPFPFKSHTSPSNG
ncbi:unnamed protein product [Lactuca saligna]|uniref:Uncharacterized protein n=1 Tax=Lactuca saligna TaxID=75948 RepID=A0AA35ZTC8_LACSI|nr:unnamed protein product [Lactuca saligna]